MIKKQKLEKIHKFFNFSAGITLVELVIAMGLVSVASLGTLTVMKQTLKVQSTSMSNNEINAFIGNLSNALTNDLTCTATMAGQTVDPTGNTPSNLLVRIGPLTYRGANVDPTRSSLGMGQIQSISFAPSSVSTVPFNKDGTVSFDKLIQGSLNLTFVRSSNNRQESSNFGANQISFNNIRLSLRTNNAGTILNCTGQRVSENFDIPPCNGPQQELYSDSGTIRCRLKTVCSADQYSVGVNANGVPICVDYPRCGCTQGLGLPDSTSGTLSSSSQAGSATMQKTINGSSQSYCVPGQTIWYDPAWRSRGFSGPLQCRVGSCPPGTIVKSMDASGNISQCGDMKISDCIDDPLGSWNLDDCGNSATGYRATRGRKCPSGSWCKGDCSIPNYSDCWLNTENPVLNNGAHTTAQCAAALGTIVKRTLDNTETLYCQGTLSNTNLYRFPTGGWPIKAMYYNQTTCNFCTDSSVCGCDTSPNVAARDRGQSCNESPLQSHSSGYYTSTPKVTRYIRVSCDAWTVAPGSSCRSHFHGRCGQHSYTTCYSYDANSSSPYGYECSPNADPNRILFY